VVNLIELIGKYVDDGKAVDLAEKIHYFALDRVTGLAFGEEFGCLQTDSDVHGYMSISKKVLPLIMLTSVFPWMVKVLTSSLLKPFWSNNMGQLGFGEIMRYVTVTELPKPIQAFRYNLQRCSANLYK
jgi:hypothetical protein